MVEELKLFLVLQGVTPAARQKLEPKLSRWERVLKARGVTSVPDLRLADKWTPSQWHDYHHIMVLFTAAAQTAHKRLDVPRKLERMLAQHAHQFRDITGIREEPDGARKKPRRMKA